jgi:deoxyribodipyrimidine photo-lyase
MRKISVFWFRRDLRLEDNTAFHHAILSGLPVLCVFIFDRYILDQLPGDDARVGFIYRVLEKINTRLVQEGSALLCFQGDPIRAWEDIAGRFEIAGVYFNRDYEPYALERDKKVTSLLEAKGIPVHSFKDQVIFEQDEVVKSDGKPFTVFTPYKNRWLQRFREGDHRPLTDRGKKIFLAIDSSFPTLAETGFLPSAIRVRDYDLSGLDGYAAARNFPALDATSHLGPHLRFGTVSIRQVLACMDPVNDIFLAELIWREFFMQILYHFPEVVRRNFKSKYDGIAWRNREDEFERWCRGTTGYPLVDAGMRQLNATGYMHNRVRMITAGFLCKDLLIDWKWGEAYFAGRLLDYELSSNNGNWQWAAGTGCDAAPYFRIFNPAEQLKKYDRDMVYVKRWVPEYGSSAYPEPIVDHTLARKRALDTFRKAL